MNNEFIMVLGQIFGVLIVVIIIAIVIFGIYQQRARKHLLLKLKENGKLPPPNENMVFFDGIVTKPVHYAPFDGHECGFFTLQIWKKTASITRKAGFDTLNAFELVYQSGDFFVQNKNDRQEYKIAVNDYYEQLLGPTTALSQPAKFLLSGETTQQQDRIIELNAHNRATESMLLVVFGYSNGKMESRTNISVPFYQKSSSTIQNVKPKANIDFKVQEFIIGQNLPDHITELLEQKNAFDHFLHQGDALIITELTIPVGQQVFIAGTLDPASNTISFRSSKIGLTVSYHDPSQ